MTVLRHPPWDLVISLVFFFLPVVLAQNSDSFVPSYASHNLQDDAIPGKMYSRKVKRSASESFTQDVDDSLEISYNKLTGHNVCQDTRLPAECTITDDCTKLDCEIIFVKVKTSLKIVIHRCDEPVTITANIKVSSRIDWTATFTSANDTQLVPGFIVNKSSLAKHRVFIAVSVSPGNSTDKLALKVSLTRVAENQSIDNSRPNKVVLNQELPTSISDCDFVRWWLSKAIVVRALLILSAVIAGVVVITGCCCCCCKPCRARKRNAKAIFSKKEKLSTTEM